MNCFISSFTNEINETALLFNDSITMEEPIILPPECTDPGLLETFLFGSLIAAVDPVAVLAVYVQRIINKIRNNLTLLKGSEMDMLNLRVGAFNSHPYQNLFNLIIRFGGFEKNDFCPVFYI